MSFRVFLQFLLSTAIYLAAAGPALGTETGPDNPLEGDMVRIPAGHFIFGTNKQDDSAEALSLGIPKPWYADEGPENKVFLKSFYIDRHEVTNRRYKIYIDDLGAIPSDYWNSAQYPEGEAE